MESQSNLAFFFQLMEKQKSLCFFSNFLGHIKKISRLQSGAIRTNCLDCLDRTNCVQTLIGMKALLLQLQDLQVEKYKAKITARFEETLKEVWQKNGDQCSIIYAGTGALEGKSKIKDASRSLARTFQNNLMDGAKQESFDLFLLGNGYFDDEFDKACRFLPSQLMKGRAFSKLPHSKIFYIIQAVLMLQVGLNK